MKQFLFDTPSRSKILISTWKGAHGMKQNLKNSKTFPITFYRKVYNFYCSFWSTESHTYIKSVVGQSVIQKRVCRT